MADQFKKGVDVIQRAAEQALHDRGVSNAKITCATSSGEAPDVEFTISRGETTHKETFTYNEVEDSGEAIDAPAAHKVRFLVSHFV